MVYGKYPRPPRYLRSAPGHLRYLEIFRDRTVARNPVLFRVAFPSFTKWIWYHRRKRAILLIIATQGLHAGTHFPRRSEEHTSELQSLVRHLVCRLLLEKTKT